MKTRKQKVIVAMSGGVDSSVAAALLKKQGYEVTGIFMHFWAEKQTDPSTRAKLGAGHSAVQNADSRRIENQCCSLEAYEDARRVAEKLNIPFYTMNLKIPFRKWVVDYFLKEYQSGRTPNPCVECNRFIKFGELLRRAKAMGVDYVATGHYARKREIKNQKSKIKNLLLKGRDKRKDQSYFLYTLTQRQLKHILFPVGDYTKSQVRQMAKKWKMPVHAKRESQEICFVTDADLRRFLKKQIGAKSGPIVESETRKKIGKHEGALLYTIGQRKGLGLAGGPWYVTAIDTKRNTLYASRNQKKLFSRELIAKNVNWTSDKEPKLPIEARAKIRYKHEGTFAKIYKSKAKSYKLIFKKSVRAITPGQSAVFYKKDEVIGGGIIEK